MTQGAIATAAPAGAGTESRWHAKLELQFEQSGNRCRLAQSRHHGPLYVQKPFYPEGRDLAHAYLLHPPGGLVSGDRLDIRVRAAADARVLLTTTGAGRVYRARRDGLAQCQENRLQLAPGSSLEWLPLENIVYPGAKAQLHTRVELAADSRFAGWEINSLGLPASAECFCSGTLSQRLEIFRDGMPLFIEALDLGGGSGELAVSAAGLGDYPVNALLVMGPFATSPDVPLLDQCRAVLDSETAEFLAGITRVGDFQVVRYLGGCTFRARQTLSQIWSLLRPALLGRVACAPRIWST